MSSNSSLTEEQLKRIAENRRIALEKKAAAEAARAQNANRQQSGASTSTGQASHGPPNPSSNANAVQTTSFYKPNEKQAAYKPAVNVTFNKTGSTVKTAASSSSNGYGPNAKKLKPNDAGASTSTASVPTKVVTGICKMISRDRFMVAAGYHQQMIELFKTIPSKVYGTHNMYGKGATSWPSNFSEPLLDQSPFLQPEARALKFQK
jgi:hypothetical protein